MRNNKKRKKEKKTKKRGRGDANHVGLLGQAFTLDRTVQSVAIIPTRCSLHRLLKNGVKKKT
jgi:hypothetical protein